MLPGDGGVDLGLLPTSDVAPTLSWPKRPRANDVFDIWKTNRHSYGMPRIRNELHLGERRGCSRTTAARLMGICGAVSIHYKRRGGCTRLGDGEVSDDLVNRAFDPDGPDRLWVMDVQRCGALWPTDGSMTASQGRRRWRALDVGELRREPEAEAPRVRCRDHGILAAPVPWARHGASETRAFDDAVAWLTVP